MQQHVHGAPFFPPVSAAAGLDDDLDGEPYGEADGDGEEQEGPPNVLRLTVRSVWLLLRLRQ